MATILDWLSLGKGLKRVEKGLILLQMFEGLRDGEWEGEGWREEGGGEKRERGEGEERKGGGVENLQEMSKEY